MTPSNNDHLFRNNRPRQHADLLGRRLRAQVLGQLGTLLERGRDAAAAGQHGEAARCFAAAARVARGDDARQRYDQLARHQRVLALAMEREGLSREQAALLVNLRQMGVVAGGSFTLADIERAFPVLVQNHPLVSRLLAGLRGRGLVVAYPKARYVLRAEAYRMLKAHERMTGTAPAEDQNTNQTTEERDRERGPGTAPDEAAA